MQKIETNIRSYFQRLRSPEVITGVASGILAALVWETVGQIAQNSLNDQLIGFYAMAVISLSCLILVSYTLMRIQKLSENRNYTQFITSKAERLNLMTKCIKNAKRSIYILSDLSGAKETPMEEQAKYLDALNHMMDDNKGNPNFEVKRIVVPQYTNCQDSEADPDWIYTTPITDANREHFKRLCEFDETSLKHTSDPCNVSVMLIDNKYLFWNLS